MNLEDHLGKLAALGSSDQIFDFFVEQDITGRPGKTRHCPVARYLTREIDVPVSVNRHVSVMWLRVRSEENGMVTLCDISESIPNPEPVAEFIYHFDHGRYPELEEAR